MTGKILFLGSLLLLPLATEAGKSAQLDKFAVVAGQRIGQIRLHDRLNTVEHRLGPSDYGDSSLGHYWRTWQAGTADARTGIRHDLDVYATVGTNDGNSYVRILRVTSPQFQTEDGMTCGSTLKQIQKRYPRARRLARYQSPQVSKPVVVFDATSQGIAFEVACNKDGQVEPTSPCVALMVHVAGQHNVQEEYYRLTTYEAGKPYTK